uniref:Protein NYNRIN-like n=1 Tax=Tanacetum cinerariifolium TaxID=118510 RepID=A0A699HC49_TANCI|nr:protein NYNRIN-like [Tanacetum cinerariifolium]
MKLNPKKCTFGMREGMFLGYKVNADGLKVCPDKVEAVLILPSPKCLKDIQKINGKLESLNRPRTSAKRPNLADFIVDRLEDDSPDTPMEDKEELSDPWVLFTDGSSCIDGSRAGLIITNPKGIEFTYALRGNSSRRKEEGKSHTPQGRPFSEDPDKFKFLIVANDYFTKWIEANPMAAITGTQIKKFVWDNIVCRFGLPGKITSDNGKQFRDNPFKDWCEKLCILRCFTFVKHPKANGLVERANRSLGEGIKARLYKRIKNWLEEISHVLWAHHTMIKSSYGEMPFSLTPFGRENRADSNPRSKDKAIMEKYYNSKVRSTSFKPGDLVYRSNDASRTKEVGKLCPKWEGPYEIIEALGKGAYKLRDRDGKQLSRTWNVRNLKRCYVHEM